MHLTHDAELKPFNAFGIPARTKALARIEHWYEIEQLSSAPEWRDLPLLILGEGTNILFRKDFPGIVLRLENRGIQVIEEDGDSQLIRVAAGENWARLVSWSASRFLWGIENLAHIPGTAGAAPIQNIGAYGCELSDTLESVTAWDRLNDQWTTLTRDDCQPGYRSSRFRDEDAGRFVITEIALRLSRHGSANLSYPGVSDALGLSGSVRPTPQDMVHVITRIRSQKLPDPRRLGNVGSFFKNPLIDPSIAAKLRKEFPEMPGFTQDDGRVKLSAAWLIEQCQWKGRRSGDAGVYFGHALVLVNHGTASGSDIWDLARQIQGDVHERFGLTLDPEPTII